MRSSQLEEAQFKRRYNLEICWKQCGIYPDIFKAQQYLRDEEACDQLVAIEGVLWMP
jgi:hypothetical protein